MKSKSYKLITSVISSCFLLACGTQNQQNAGSNLSATSDGQVQDWTDPMVIQRGYDVVSGEIKGDCTAPATLDTGIPGANGNVGFWRIDFIQSTEDLQKSMDVSASARMSTATGATASAKASYSNSLHINSYSVYALASVQIEKTAQNYKDVKLKPTYESLLNSMNPNKMKLFRQRCGDKFIIGQKSGGEYYTLIEIKATTKEEKEKISASVKGKVGMYSASGSFASALNTLSTQYELHFSAFKVGGSSEPVPTEPQAMIARAAGFEKEVDERSVPFKAILANYDTVENFPFEDPIATEAAIKVIEELNKSRLVIDGNRSNILYVLANPSQFATADGTYLSDKINELNAAENKILNAARACSKDIANCVLPTDLGDISVKLPDWGDNKPKQVFGAHPSCGVEEYNSRTDEACGVESTVYKNGNGPSCGVSGYEYNSSRGPACGAELYRQGKGGACGNTVYVNLGPGKEDFEACRREGGRVYQAGSGPATWEQCEGGKVCRDASFGVEVYKECTDASFGIKNTLYNSCRDSAFGVESTTYKTCALPNFGVKKYKECMHDL